MKNIRNLLCLTVCLLLLLPAGVLAQEEEELSVWSYASDTLTINIERVVVDYSASKKLTYYLADIHVSDPAQLFSAFSQDEYTRSAREDTESIAERNGAVLAVNGDYYNHDTSIGITLRNGELYRDKHAPRDLLIIDKEGNMRVVLKDNRREGKSDRLVTGEELLAEDVWQTFEFGPAIIENGQALTLPEKYFIYTNDRIREPRTVIGQVGPLHYVVLVADGRRSGWSDEGMQFPEMQEVLLAHGCQVAYNLDGGGSTTLYFDGEIINRPAGGKQRQVSDIVCFGE